MSIFENLLGSLFGKMSFLNGNKTVKNQIKNSNINAPVYQAETINNHIHGPTQRVLTLEIKQKLLTQISIDDLISVTPNTKDRESLNFAAEIAQYLKSQGLNVSLNSNGSITTIGGSVSIGEGIEISRSDKKINPNLNPMFRIVLPNCWIIIN